MSGEREELLRLISGLSCGGGSDGLYLVRASRTEEIPSFIINERVKQLIRSHWTERSILSNGNNKCQEDPTPTLDLNVLRKAGVSVSCGLTLVGKGLRTQGLKNPVYNNKVGTCKGLDKPDDIFDIKKTRFQVQIGDKPYVLMLPDKLQPTCLPPPLNVLELFSGNGRAAIEFIAPLLASGITITNYVSTDIIEFPGRVDLECDNFEFHKADALDAVKRFGEKSNTLLFISPPPAGSIKTEEEIKEKGDKGELGYGDFYACDEYIKQTLVQNVGPKSIFFVGELGAGDGTTGMYKYLMEHPHLKLIYRNRISYTNLGIGAGIKEVYIFKIE